MSAINLSRSEIERRVREEWNVEPERVTWGERLSRFVDLLDRIARTSVVDEPSYLGIELINWLH